jgi:L-fuculose-phosphate aldolase
MHDLALRTQILVTARDLQARGLNQGSSGNVSARSEKAFLITPSGVVCDILRPEHIVEVHLDGNVPPGQLTPSSEWALHREIYLRRDEVCAIVHTHSSFATTLACARREIPAFHYMVATAGGSSIRCAPYATFGTPELATGAVHALDGRTACLLANHGLIAVGETLHEARKTAAEIEELATIYCRTLQIGGPVLLDDEEMGEVLQRFKTYGQRHRTPHPEPIPKASALEASDPGSLS